MVKAKTGITLLKRLGFVLIALPEPFTTPIGVACILASGYLSKLRESSLNKHLHETLTLYLSHTKRSNAETDNKSHARQKAKGYIRTEDPTILWQNKNSSAVETNPLPSVRRNRRDIEENTVHHSVDTQFLTRRYEVIDGSEAKTGSFHSDVMLTETGKLIHHNVDTQFLARRYAVTDKSEAKAGSSHPDVATTEFKKLVHHNVDTQFLARRYATKNGSKATTESSHSDVALVNAEKMILHSIDMQMLGRRYRTEDSANGASNLADKPGSAENVVKHRIQTVSLPRRYQGNDSARTDSNETRTSDTAKILEHRSRKIIVSDEAPTFDAPETLEHHSIDLQFLSRRYETAGASPVKAKARPLAMAFA